MANSTETYSTTFFETFINTTESFLNTSESTTAFPNTTELFFNTTAFLNTTESANYTSELGNVTAVDELKNTIISDDHLAAAKFYIYVIIVPILCVFGLTGNSIALVVFSDVAQTLKLSTYRYMMTLISVDLSILVVALVRSVPFIIGAFENEIGKYWQAHTLIPVIYCDQSLSVMNAMILIVLSIDRLVAIRMPFTANHMTIAKHPVRILATISCVVFLSLAPLPMCLKFESTAGANDTVVYDISVREELREVYFVMLIFTTILTYVLYAILITLNITIQYSIIVRRRLRNLSKTTASQSSDETQHRLSVTILIIIFMYTVLNLPLMFIMTLAMVDETYTIGGREENTFRFVSDIINVLIVINSSVDFVIYILRSEPCIAKFQEKFCLKRVSSPGPITSPPTGSGGSTNTVSSITNGENFPTSMENVVSLHNVGE